MVSFAQDSSTVVMSLVRPLEWPCHTIEEKEVGCYDESHRALVGGLRDRQSAKGISSTKYLVSEPCKEVPRSQLTQERRGLRSGKKLTTTRSA